MRKNAFTPDGGPHRPDRIRNVSDGLKRLGEFEAAEMLTNYAALLRERESAKAAVTDKAVEMACRKYYNSGNPVYPPVFEAMRAALEAVAPMLASARVLDGQCSDIRTCAHCGKPEMNCDCHDTSGFRMLPGACGVSRMWDNEKAVLVSFERKPTDDELRALHDLLAAAPKPEGK